MIFFNKNNFSRFEITILLYLFMHIRTEYIPISLYVYKYTKDFYTCIHIYALLKFMKRDEVQRMFAKNEEGKKKEKERENNHFIRSNQRGVLKFLN